VSHALKLLGLLGLLLILQQLVAAVLPEAVRPDLLLVFALALGLRSPAVPALLLSFGLGVMVDLLSGTPTGTFALLRGTACALTRFADRALYLRAPVPWAIYAAFYQAVDVGLLALVTWLILDQPAVGSEGLVVRIPGTMVATGLVAIPVAAALQRWGLADPDPSTTGWAPGRSRP
jgi:cell shape-determining protein MreD